jgi:DHA2 family multidrug resistance protein-like MFS transporter
MTANATTDPTAAAPRATVKEWTGLAVLALPCILYSMDLTVLNLAVPKLTADLGPSAVELLWIVDIYGFVLAGALLPMGVIGDRIGRRRLLMIGAAAFGLASIAAAFSTTVWMLIAARALLGLAAATLAPSTLSLVTNMFRDPAQRTFAIGVWIASFSSGAAIGPVLGGVVLEYYWWGAVFLLNVPIMVLLLAVGPWLLPEAREADAPWPDVVSAVLSMIAVLSLVYGIKLFAHSGLSLAVGAALVAGLLMAAIFVRRQNRLADPLIDLALFRRPAFSTALAVNIFGFFIAFGSFLLIAQYLQLALGLSPLEAGLWSAPSGIAFVAGALLTPLMTRLVAPPRLVALALTVAAGGFLMLGIDDNPALGVLITGHVIFSFALAPVFTLTTDLIVSAAPPERAGSAAGIAETSTELGGALGIALLGSLASALYRMDLESSVRGIVAGDAIAAASEALGRVSSLAAALPAEQGAALIAAAQAAFGNGFQMAALASAAIALLTAAVTFLVIGWQSAPGAGPFDAPMASR